MEFQYQPQQQQSIGNLPSTTSNEKTLLWSQPTQYMVDSGYTTQAPSISSIDAFLNEEQMETVAPPPQYQQQQQPPPPPRTDWSAQEMQPPAPMGGIPSSTSLLQTQPQPPLPTPSMPQHQQNSDNSALENWMQYQDDSEALKSIPDVIKLLNDEDHVVVSQAAALVHQFSKKRACCMALIDSPEVLPSLVNCLVNDANIETAKNVVGTFYNMSLHKQAIPNIINNTNVLPSLVNFLSVPVEAIVSFSITTLHNVLLAYNDIKAQLRKYGAIQKMVPLLRKHTNAKFLAIVVDCLQQLAYGHQESKLAILELGGPEVLVEILKNSTYPKLILQTTRLLKVLSVCTQNKKALINFGAMQALGLHLNSTSSNEIHNSLITLRNLSDAATRMNGLEHLIEMLVKLMQSSEEPIILLAAGILSNLTCNNENNKILVMRLEGIPMLIRLVQNSMDKPDLIEPCICILRHITNRHKDASIAQDQLKLNNGLELIAKLISVQPRKWAVIKATLGVLRNFASNSINLPLFRNQLIIERLMQVTYDAYNEIQRTAVVDDVKLVDIIDVSLNIISCISKDFQSQLIMRDMNCIAFIVQLFYSPVSKLSTLAASILVDFVQNKDCIESIDQQPGIHMFLTKFINYPATPDNQISSYAKMMMQCIQEYKTNKMRMIQQQQMQQQQQQQMLNFNQNMQQNWPPQNPAFMHNDNGFVDPYSQSQMYNQQLPPQMPSQQQQQQHHNVFQQPPIPQQQQQQQQLMPGNPQSITYDGFAIL